MSESEQMGQCRKEVDDRYGSPCELVIADAIDRLAADVAEVKEAVVSPKIGSEQLASASDMEWLERHVQWRREERDEARKERDQARASVERLKKTRDAANRLYGATLAEVERLKNELYDREQELLSLRADTVERCEPPAAPQPAAPLPGWLTDDERAVLDDLASRIERWVNTDKYEADRKRLAALRSILARAGSPPVVEVPAISRRDVPMQNEAFAYRDALDKAGVKWKEKEVPRE